MLKKTAEEEKRDGGANAKETSDTTAKAQPRAEYRSQKDVDEAFKKRFSALREKWEIDQKEKEKEKDDEQTALQLIRHIEAGAKDFYDTYPDVDIAAVISNDPLFTYLLMKGKGLTETYAFLYDSESDGRMRRQVEQEILSNLKARNHRPHVLAAANSGGTSRDIARLSDAEILRIDSRIKNGERVTL